MAPDFSGMIPLGMFAAHAAGVERLAAGASGLAGTVADGLREVSEAGQWAEAREGLYRFEQDALREMGAGGSVDDLQSRWRTALTEKLPSYLPSGLSGRVKDRVDAARQSLAEAGNIYAQKMARLGTVDKARRAWSDGVRSAVARGDVEQAGSRVSEGTGVFVTADEARGMAETVRNEATLQGALHEVRRDPAAAAPVLQALQSGRPVNEMERRVAAEFKVTHGELKKRYADAVLMSVAAGGRLNDEGLANAERYGLVDSGQVRRYAEARDRMSRAEWDGVKALANPGLLCRMAMLIDEDCGGDRDSDAVIEVATSGLPARQVAALARRREVMLQVPQEVRRAASRRLSAMFRSGAWGPVSDARAVEEWGRVQQSLMAAAESDPAHAADAMERVFERENRLQDCGWVGFNEMNKQRKENK